MSKENSEQNLATLDQEQETKPIYKSFGSKEEFEKFIEDTKAKFTSEIKKRLKKEAEMTAEQKLQSKIDDLERDKKALTIDKNRTKAERLFIAKGISENACNELLNFIVDADEEATLNRANSLLKFIDTASKMIADEKIKKTMKDVKSPRSGTEERSGNEIGIAKILGKIRAHSEKTAKETVNKYF